MMNKSEKDQRNKLSFMEKPETEIAHEYARMLESTSMHTRVLTLTWRFHPLRFFRQVDFSTFWFSSKLRLVTSLLGVAIFSGEENSREIAMNVILPGSEVNLDMILIHNSVSTDLR